MLTQYGRSADNEKYHNILGLPLLKYTLVVDHAHKVSFSINPFVSVIPFKCIWYEASIALTRVQTPL